MPLATRLQMSLLATLSKAFDLATPAPDLAYAFSKALTTGVALDQADKLFHDTRTTAGNDDIDLSGVLTDIFGDVITLARVKGIILFNALASTGNLVVGNGANPFINWVGAAAHTISVRPGGLFVLFAPDATAYAVTAGTGDILRVAASAGSVTYDVIIIGASA